MFLKRLLSARQWFVLLLAGTATPIAYAFSTVNGVAEPGNLTLLGLGLIGLGTIRRMSRQASEV